LKKNKKTGAVDTLVGGRGVRTVVHTFPVADAGGGAPTVRDDCVTLTPVVVRPRRPARDQSAKSSGAAGGPLRVPPARADTRDSPRLPKRARTDEPSRKNTVFSAYAADAADAESVCYHGQLAAMPGKFDASKADALGVPRGAVRGALVRGEDVVLPDGRTIRSEDVVARRRAGFRFAVVDVPTIAHLEALADPTSDAGRRFGEVCGAAGEDEGEGRLAVVVHLAPAAVATSAAYKRWMETCGAFHTVGDGTNPFDRPRHLMVHSEATGGACVFRSAAAVNARLHAVDANVFPEPRNAERAVADAQARALADAAAREADGSSKTSQTHHVLTHPGCNLSRFTLVPLDAAGLDARAVPRALVARSVREDLDVAAAVARSRGPSARSDAYLSEEVPSALRALSPGDVELVFLGTGSSMPAKYRNVSGLFLDQKTRGGVILDCGEGSFGQLCRLYGAETARAKVRDLRCAWISHIHADHHVGLPTILVERRRAMLADGVREDAVEPLLVVGPAPLRRFLNAFSQVEPLSFDFVDCRETTSEKWDRLEKLEKLEGTLNDGQKHEVDESLKIVDPRVSAAARSLGLRRLVSVPVAHCAQSFALALEAAPPAGADAGWKAVYSGDTRPCAALVAAARDATVLIHEATFEDDLLEDAVKKRHSTTSEAIQTGVNARCYRTILTHFSQRYPKAPKFDGHIGNGEGEVREDTNQNDANQDDDSDARSRKNVSDRVGVAFDLMRVDFTALPRVPSLMPAVRALFPDPVEDAAPAEEAAAE
jgi:ribonuclease Z